MKPSSQQPGWDVTLPVSEVRDGPPPWHVQASHPAFATTGTSGGAQNPPPQSTSSSGYRIPNPGTPPRTIQAAHPGFAGGAATATPPPRQPPSPPPQPNVEATPPRHVQAGHPSFAREVTRPTPKTRSSAPPPQLAKTALPPQRSNAPQVVGRLPTFRIKVSPGSGAFGQRNVTPQKTRQREDARWIPPGSLANALGFDIPGGMIYVGSFMTASPGGSWGAETPAPCLINPSLKVASGTPNLQSDMGYWPSYSGISPEQRLTYLTWLSTGKRDTRLPIGYAFLYFYGLERRLLVDNPNLQEELQLVGEVERLRALYAGNGSFSFYSRTLLDLIELRRQAGGPNGLSDYHPDLMSISRSSFPSMPLQIKLGLHAVSGISLDWELATAAMLSMSPGQGGPPSSIGMSRSKTEFIELVRRRFQQKFPNGFRLRDRKDSTLILGYRPAAQHLDIGVQIEGIKRVPDPTTLNWADLPELCRTAAEDLNGYAKTIGKN